MKLYIIHYKGDENNPYHFEGVTDNFDKWLEEHNSQREEDIQEDADDFDVEEIELSFGVRGGYSSETLQNLSVIAKKYKVKYENKS